MAQPLALVGSRVAELLAQPLALVGSRGWLTGLAHGVGSGGFLREVTSETPIAVATLETEFPVRFRFLFCPNHYDLRRSA